MVSRIFTRRGFIVASAGATSFALPGQRWASMYAPFFAPWRPDIALKLADYWMMWKRALPVLRPVNSWLAPVE